MIFTISVIAICYYTFLMPQEITKIIFDEYISFILLFILFGIYLYFKFKLKKFPILEFMPNRNKIPLIQSLLIFLVFQMIDYIYEDGFMGMIKLWFMYWLYAFIAMMVINLINSYKNMQFYKLKLFL